MNLHDQVRRDDYNRQRRSSSGEGKWIKGTRCSLLKDTANQTPKQLLKLAEVVLSNKRMYWAFLLLGELRYLYRLLTGKRQNGSVRGSRGRRAQSSKLKPFVKLARTIRKHKTGVLAAIQFGMSNGRLEALTGRVRLISHRGRRTTPADALIAMVYLGCAGIQIPLPSAMSHPQMERRAQKCDALSTFVQAPIHATPHDSDRRGGRASDSG